ncbi:MAG: hypothetical protein M1827_007349 [Pycnora praestabilis]|nr:MAG: hypothetical protein M1827_007349 [Pycnora praestabilis]
MTLLLHRRALMKDWKKVGGGIELSTHGLSETRTGFDVELVLALRDSTSKSSSTEVDADPGQFQPQERNVGSMEPPFPEGDADPVESNAGSESPSLPPQADEISSQESDLDFDNFDSEFRQQNSTSTELDIDQKIFNLIVTTKAGNTVSALRRIKHRLSRESTILFLQNGMGILEEVNSKLFPDVETRPNYMLGIVTHGVNSERPFRAVHAGLGTIALGIIPRYERLRETNMSKSEPKTQWASSSRFMLRTITRTPVLAAVGFSHVDLMQLQIEKLAVNAIINPLTAMFDSSNGELLFNFAFTRVMRLLLAEISLVIRSLPEIQGVPNVKMRFSPERLETLVVSVANKTSTNTSSMLQDVRAGKITEVDFINGYIVKRGEEMGIKCVMNYMLMQMVKGKQDMFDRQNERVIPIAAPGDSEES